jgi:hypothetical protein
MGVSKEPAMTTTETLRTAYAAERTTVLTRGWSASSFRTLVEAMVSEKTPEGYVVAAKAATQALADAARTGDLPEALEGTVELVGFDLFCRAWNKDAVKRFSEANKRHSTIYLPAGSDLSAVLSAARSAGCRVGASDTGTYEVQGDRGIWKHYRSMRIDASDIGTDRVIFLTWEEMEKIELAGGEPFSEVTEPVAMAA